MAGHEGPYWDQYSKQFKVAVTLTPDEADGIAFALGSTDKGGEQLNQWAAQARKMQEEHDA